MELCICLPYAGAEKLTPYWATQERQIDFLREPEAAARCTLAFAAMELAEHLRLFFPGIKIRFDREQPTHRPEETVISLRTESAERDCAFSWLPQSSGLTITGRGRTGALYGAYEFLRLQGIRWLSPDEGAVRLQDYAGLVLPSEAQSFTPSMPLGRGFVFEGCMKESENLWLWMTRNRLNLASFRPNSGALQRKLGMTFLAGGHIFEKMLDPGRVLSNGKTIWETHWDWYGTPSDGELTPETAQHNQFCVSKPELVDFLAEELLTELTARKWKETDRLEIAGFDTWGNGCGCAACRALGNSSDQYLYFAASIRRRLNRAAAENRLNRPIRLALDVYEGTATLEPPLHAVPPELREAGDYIVYYPIIRCYQHGIDDPGCSYNAVYHRTLAAWKGIEVTVGEYYNVSKFEDLPLLFTRTLPHDLGVYRRLGVTGMTYMHLPMMRWGMRTLTQLLYAQMAWDTHTDVPQFLEEYFAARYGVCAAEAREAYELTEEAMALISSWRAWGQRSILTRLMNWDGKKPKEVLCVDDHFQNDMEEKAAASVEKLQKALAILRQIRDQEKRSFARTHCFHAAVPVNPTDTSFANEISRLEESLGEDIRSLSYGVDMMALMGAFVQYYELMRTDGDTEACWNEIELLAERMAGYYMPLTYDSGAAEIFCRDAFTRSQLKPLYFRCLQERIR